MFDELLSYEASTDTLVSDVFASFRPTESSALSVIWNLATTEPPGDLLIPARHVLSPISAWPSALKQKLRLIREFRRLKSRVDCMKISNENLQVIPRIPSFATEILHYPFKFWSCDLSAEAFAMADEVERSLHYNAAWAIPLWVDSMGSNEEVSIAFWNLALLQIVVVNYEAVIVCDTPSRADLSDMFFVYEGRPFALCAHTIPANIDLGSRLTIDNIPANIAVSVGAAAGSPSARLLAPLAGLSARALDEAEKALRSPFNLPDVKLAPSMDAVPPGHVGSNIISGFGSTDVTSESVFPIGAVVAHRVPLWAICWVNKSWRW